MNEKGALIALRGVTKLHRKSHETIRALDGIDLDVAEKGMMALVGASGSGKSSCTSSERWIGRHPVTYASPGGI